MSIRFCGDRIFAQSTEGFPNNVKDGAQLYFYDVKREYYLTSGVWTEFFGSGSSSSSIQNAITGVGTPQYLPIWSSTTGLNNSDIFRSNTPTVPLYTVDNSKLKSYQYANEISFVTLTSDSVTTLGGACGTLIIYSDINNANPGSRRLAFSSNNNNFTQGEEKLFIHGSGSWMVPNSGNIRLVDNWIPTISGDCLKLQFDGGWWTEQFRFPPYSGSITGFSSVTNGITGAGILNYISKFVSTSGIGNSSLLYNSSDNLIYPSGKFGLNNINPTLTLQINGGFGVDRAVGSSMVSGLTTTYIVNNISYIKISSQSQDANASNFTFSSAGETIGHRLLVEWGSGFAKLPNNSGVMRLNGDWIPGAGDILGLVSNQDGLWLETYRKVFSGVNTSTQNIINGITGSGASSFVPIFSNESGIVSSDIQKVSTLYYDFGSNQIRAINRVIRSSTANIGATGDPTVLNSIFSDAEWLKVATNSNGDPYSNKIASLAPTNVGQQQLFSWVSGSGVILQNSGIMRLNSDFILQSGAYLRTFYDGNYWREEWRYPSSNQTGITGNAYLGKTKLTAGKNIISNTLANNSNTLLFATRESGEGVLGHISSFISGGNIVIYSSSNTETSYVNWKLEKFY